MRWTPETLFLLPFLPVPFLGDSGALASRALGRGSHFFLDVFMERQQQRMKRSCQGSRRRKTGGKARRLQGIKKRCLSTRCSVPRRWVLVAVWGWHCLVAHSEKKLCILEAKRRQFVFQEWPWGPQAICGSQRVGLWQLCDLYSQGDNRCLSEAYQHGEDNRQGLCTHGCECV